MGFLSKLFRTFAHSMEPTNIEDRIFEIEPLEEEGSVLMVAESSWRGMADELEDLQ